VSAADEARTHFEAHEYGQARASAMAVLGDRPDDVEMLRLAGRAGVETGAEDAVDLLRRLTELAPDDAAAWRDLGDALATDGRTEEARDAFRRAVDLDPSDEASLTALGHAAYATGNERDAVNILEQAAERSGSQMSTAQINLVDMYRAVGQPEEALAAAARIAEAAPDDALAALDVAELSLELGRLDEAVAAYERVRALDDIIDHEVYALQGMIAAEMARERWEPALALAREAVALDRGRSADVLAFLEAQNSVPPTLGEEPPPSREQVDAALEAARAEHRRSHAEDRRPNTEDSLG
jgi:tetratricopeptide (TPR) repeat protein